MHEKSEILNLKDIWDRYWPLIVSAAATIACACLVIGNGWSLFWPQVDATITDYSFVYRTTFVGSYGSRQSSDSATCVLFDKALPGFAVRVFKSCKTYVVQSRVGGKSIRRTIGKHGHFTAEQARVEAQSLLALMAKYHDPNAVKAERKVKGITTRNTGCPYLIIYTICYNQD